MTDFTEFAPIFDKFLYGGIASVFAETITFPIDTAKTRLQLQGEFGNYFIFLALSTYASLKKYKKLLLLHFTSQHICH